MQKRDSNKVAGQNDEIRLQLVDKQNCSGNRFCCEKWMIVEVAEMRDREVVENGRKTLQCDCDMLHDGMPRLKKGSHRQPKRELPLCPQ